jgi:hypothetical protein
MTPWENNRGSRGGYVSAKVKDEVRKRDRHCVLGYPGCEREIQEFHHPTGLADQNSRRTSVLDASAVVGVCRSCHSVETRKQISAGRNRWKRPVERHPGLRW